MHDTIIQGDALTTLKTLPENTVDCCVTSPPYFALRDYQVAGQLGLEATPGEYVANLVAVFREVRRVLTPRGTLWLNLGDAYANDTKWGGRSSGKNVTSERAGCGGQKIRRVTGYKPKDLMGLPWRVAFALQEDGWYLRSDIIWEKPNAMPESVKDRPTKAHEYLFMLAKSQDYYYDADAIREPYMSADRVGDRRSYKPGSASSMHTGEHQTMTGSFAGLPLHALGRNKRTVWTVPTKAYKGAHFATFPPALVEPCIKAGCPEGGVVLDPFLGSGTTAAVAQNLGRHYLGIELNAEYVALAQQRLSAA